jgi:hypothetical protein
MTKAGWKVSKKQPVPKGEVPVYRAIKGRDPVMGRIRMVHAASGAECFADDKQVSAMEAAGWVDPSKPAASAAAVVGGEMQMSVPPMIVKLQPFSAHVEQQLQGVTEEVAGVQFSSEAEGAPWVTAGGPGSGGAIEAAPVQFSAQNPSWDYPVIVARAHCWMRVGVWADQILSGPPVVTSNAVEIRPKAVAPQSDPEPRPSK